MYGGGWETVDGQMGGGGWWEVQYMGMVVSAWEMVGVGGGWRHLYT